MFDAGSRIFGMTRTPDRSQQQGSIFGDLSSQPDTFGASANRRRGSIPSGGSTAASGLTDNKKVSSDNNVNPTEPPILPVTIRVLQNAANNGDLSGGRNRLYGSVEFGVVIIAGWVIDNATDGEVAEFEIADGTTPDPIKATIDYRSDSENWMRSEVKKTILKSAILKLIGIPHIHEGELRLRCLHFRKADHADWAYGHVIEVAHAFLVAKKHIEVEDGTAVGSMPQGIDCDDYVDGEDTAAQRFQFNFDGTTPGRHSGGENDPTGGGGGGGQSLSSTGDQNSQPISQYAVKTSKPDHVELPASYGDVENISQRLIIRFIMDNGSGEIGVPRQQIISKLRSMMSAREVDEALQELEDVGNVFPTIDDHFDIIRDSVE